MPMGGFGPIMAQFDKPVKYFAVKLLSVFYVNS